MRFHQIKRSVFTGILAVIMCAQVLALTAETKIDSRGPAEVKSNDTRLASDGLRILGVWTSNCYNPASIAASGQNIFVKDIYSFGAGGNYTLESDHFSDENCTEAQGNPQLYFGEYRLGDLTTNIEGDNLRRIALTLDSTDWPAQLPAAQLQWVMGFIKNRLAFGAFNPAFNRLTPGVWFEKDLSPNTSVLVF